MNRSTLWRNRTALWLGCLVALAAAGDAHAGGARMDLHRELKPDFVPDINLLQEGRVQYFFGLVAPDGEAFKDDTAQPGAEVLRAFDAMKRLDTGGVWRLMPREKLHALVTRVAYVAGQPIGFFTEEQTRDVDFMNEVAPAFKVHTGEDGVFEISACLWRGIPSSKFTMDYLSADAARKYLMPLDSRPAEVVVLQRNFDFGRIMGFKTSRASYSATAHFPLDAGRTVVVNCSLGYIHHIPPLNAANIIRETAIEYSADLIEKLRLHSPRAGGN